MSPPAHNEAPEAAGTASAPSEAWLARFHSGDRELLAEIYREQGAVLLAVVGGILSGVDRENVVHDLFASLLSSEPMRRGFTGGSLSAWLRQVARNRALDHLRRVKRRRETDLAPGVDPIDPAASPVAGVERDMALRLVERLRAECVPGAWRAVFEARFVQQLSQRDAAKSLGIRRTTLAYQEARLRVAIMRYLRKSDRGLFYG
jgi:RNA polymerase sigma-70 factor, ECF subfamily